MNKKIKIEARIAKLMANNSDGHNNKLIAKAYRNLRALDRK